MKKIIPRIITSIIGGYLWYIGLEAIVVGLIVFDVLTIIKKIKN